MAKKFKCGCCDCKYYKRGISRFSCFGAKGDGPRLRTTPPRCLNNQPGFKDWLNNNIGKKRSEFSEAPSCLVLVNGLQELINEFNKDK